MTQTEIDLKRALIASKAEGATTSELMNTVMRLPKNDTGIAKLNEELDAAQAVLDNA